MHNMTNEQQEDLSTSLNARRLDSEDDSHTNIHNVGLPTSHPFIYLFIYLFLTRQKDNHSIYLYLYSRFKLVFFLNYHPLYVEWHSLAEL